MSASHMPSVHAAVGAPDAAQEYLGLWLLAAPPELTAFWRKPGH